MLENVSKMSEFPSNIIIKAEKRWYIVFHHHGPFIFNLILLLYLWWTSSFNLGTNILDLKNLMTRSPNSIA